VNKYHPHLTQVKWDKFSKAQQILSVGAELGRAKSMIMKNDFVETSNCYFRAIELIDLIIKNITWKKNLKEVFRFREMLGYGALFKQNSLNFCLSMYQVLLSWDKETIKVKYR